MRKFIKRILSLTAAAAVALAGSAAFGAEAEVPVVYFTKDISPAGLLKIYDKISADITGKVAVKTFCRCRWRGRSSRTSRTAT